MESRRTRRVRGKTIGNYTAGGSGNGWGQAGGIVEIGTTVEDSRWEIANGNQSELVSRASSENSGSIDTASIISGKKGISNSHPLPESAKRIRYQEKQLAVVRGVWGARAEYRGRHQRENAPNEKREWGNPSRNARRSTSAPP